MAEPGCWASAQKHGLLSTSALLDLFAIDGAERHAIESQIRPESVTIRHREYGTAVIRDNKPLRRDNLERRLDGMSVGEWCEMLNRHVFFWPTEEHLQTLLNAQAYSTSRHEVITINTALLVARHQAALRLSPINSENTIYPPKRKYGRETFKCLDDYPYAERLRARGRRDAVVEVAVEDRVPNILDLVMSVECRQGSETLGVIFRGD